MAASESTRPHRTALAAPARTGTCSTCGARAASVCSAIEDHDLSRLEAVAETVRMAPGTVFITEGEPADRFLNITSGTAKLFKLLPDGRRQITGFADVGRFLGLAAADQYGFSAEAIDAVTACRFSRARLGQLIHDAPQLEARLLRIASTELAAAQEQMLLLGRKTALERVASFLLERDASVPVCLGSGSGVSLPMTRTDIADYLGLTIETVSRTLSTLRTRGLISIDRPTEISILLPDRLRALAAGEG